MDSDDERDPVFAISDDLVAVPSYKAAATSALDFGGLLTKPLTLHEDLKEGCGGQLWPAGMVLGTYLLRLHREKLRGKTIVELGAGGGLVGLAVALGCPLDHPLYITDQAPLLSLMEKNIALNNLEGRVKPAILDWGCPVPPEVPAQPDIILAADCVYFEPAFPLLQKTLVDMIGDNTVVYFCFKRRRRADVQFMKVAKKLFKVETIGDDPDAETYRRENIQLCTLRKKQAHVQ
ncbi:hypothetical protein L228DRAFT_280803 [Xylona heveae TC161]|uniref:Protein-lysine N-methyltransferase EFM6 n=1 Tax=Xylona heveae (strain CBS 132557 / TC161) TaxID=1328760 RepID=A0A165IZ26_XYLHT|nr:hypothetical protein L228DRAFT_280803 [Xylona heveae TC161]KZF25571.1 hypothetical protein L228DRAFT_280803 [Xylona heveae TC161]